MNVLPEPGICVAVTAGAVGVFVVGAAVRVAVAVTAEGWVAVGVLEPNVMTNCGGFVPSFDEYPAAFVEAAEIRRL